MVSEEEMCEIMKGVRCIGPNNAGVKEAAHAIAEAMKEGVVWEGPAKIGKHGGVDLISPVSGETYGAFSPWPPGRLEETPIGQRLQLTVTKVQAPQGSQIEVA